MRDSVQVCPLCDRVIVSQERHRPRCTALYGISWLRMDPLTLPPLRLDFSERLTAVRLIAARGRPNGSADAETLLLNWRHGYWHATLCELLSESAHTATLNIDLLEMDELDIGGHPRDAIAVWQIADLLEQYTDYAGDLDQEGFQVVLRAITDIRELERADDDGEDEDVEDDDGEDEDDDLDFAPLSGSETATSSMPSSAPGVADLRALELRVESMEVLAGDLLEAGSRAASRSGHSWSQEEVERMILLYQDGETLIDIARRLGRSDRAVMTRMASVLDLIRPDDAFLANGQPAFPDLDVPWGLYRDDADL